MFVDYLVNDNERNKIWSCIWHIIIKRLDKVSQIYVKEYSKTFYSVNLIARRHDGSRRRYRRSRNDFERRTSDVHRWVGQADVGGVVRRCNGRRFVWAGVVGQHRFVRRDVGGRRQHHCRSRAWCRGRDERGGEEPFGNVVRFWFSLFLRQPLPEQNQFLFFLKKLDYVLINPNFFFFFESTKSDQSYYWNSWVVQSMFWTKLN